MQAAPVVALLLALVAPGQDRPDRVAQVIVQGNLLTPDVEVIRLAGVAVGMPAGPSLADEAAARLRATGRFRRVEVRRRLASLSDPSQVSLVIVVDEGPVSIEGGRDGEPARVVARRWPRLLFLPLIAYEDGYGLTYGLRLTHPGTFGERSRVSVPLSWGGHRRAAVELDRSFPAGAVSRIAGGAGISRRRHPFFDDGERRVSAWLDVERALLPALRAGGAIGWEQASLLASDDEYVRVGAELVLDTRIDPVLARDAVYLRARWERAGLPRPVHQATIDVRGYLGLPARSVLTARVLREDGTGTLPPHLKPILGGAPNLRGFRRGHAVGDALTAGSIEWRLPLSPPLGAGAFGVSAFVDVGRAYPDGERLSDGALERAVGGGVWFSVAVLRLNVAVARAPGGAARVHVSTGLSP